MKLHRLTIRRMPGFPDQGFSLNNLSDELNLIIGPNGSGKTTACRAIRGLLWPDTLRGQVPVSLLGEWRQDGHLVTLEIEGDRLICQIDGAPVDPPSLPDAHLANCFTITVDDLFAEDGIDAALASRVARAMAGGYDISAVRGLDAFTISRRHGRAEADAMRQARMRVQTIQAEQESLQAEERELDRLRGQEGAARAAQVRLGRLKDVRQLIEVRSHIVRVKSTLEGFPQGMDKLRGNEGQILDQIEMDIDAAKGDLLAADDRARQAEAQKSQAALPEQGISEDRIAEQSAHLEGLRKIEERSLNLRQRIGEARTHMETAAAPLAGIIESLDLVHVDLPRMDQIEAFHRQIERVQAQQAGLEGRLAALGPEESLEDTDVLSTGIGILREWFEAQVPVTPVRDRSRPAVYVLATLLGVTGVTLALVLSPWWILLSAFAIAAVAFSTLSRQTSGPDPRQACQSRYGRLSLESPGSWDAESVGKHLGALEQRLAHAHQAKQRQAERNSCLAQLGQVQEQAVALGGQRKGLLGQGTDLPETSDLTLVVLATNLLRYQGTQASLASLEREMAELEGAQQQKLRQVNAYLLEFGAESCDSYEIGRIRAEAIAKRAALQREACVMLRAAQQAVDGAQGKIRELERRRAEVFACLGLSDDDRTGLGERLVCLEQFRGIIAELGQLEAQREGLQVRLADVLDLAEMAEEQVSEEENRLTALAEGHQALVERIADIRNRVGRAGQETRLEEALAELDMAKKSLAARRDEAVLAAAGTFLLNRVEAAHEVQSQPQVLRQARYWFSTFTRGRYDLRCTRDGGESTFRAFDNTVNRGLELDELSRGTRMQLLLAVRLAFASEASQSRPPLVLDEVLSSTDPVRFRAVTECLVAIAREGWQIFYCTCQPADAHAWRQAALEMGISDAKVLDLATIRTLEQASTMPLADVVANQTQLPDPGSMSLPEYAEVIHAPAFDPWMGAASLHVAYLAEDACQLHRLLAAGIDRYGQLKSLMDYGRADAYLPREAQARYQSRACIADATCQAWQVGRGRRVSREVLAEAGVSTSFLDRVTDLARDLDWDAKRLIEALRTRGDERARGFRSNALESILQNLAASGHLDQRETLGQQEALNHVLAAADEEVRAGRIPLEQIPSLFDRYWSMCNNGR